MIVITLFFLIQSYLEIGQCSSCKLKNTENNLLTMAIGETYRLPLSTYFSGEGLTFELSQDSGFEVSNHMWGPGKIIGNIISITSLSVNNNPYIQSFQYFALTQQSLGSEQYFIYASSIQQENLYTISFQNQIANITSQFCGAINTISQLIVVTCLSNSTLNYFVYNIQGELQNTFIIPEINITSETTYLTEIYIESQASNQYIVQLIYIEYYEEFLYAFQFNGTTQPNLLLYLVDNASGFSLEENLCNIVLIYQNRDPYSEEEITAITTWVTQLPSILKKDDQIFFFFFGRNFAISDKISRKSCKVYNSQYISISINI